MSTVFSRAAAILARTVEKAAARDVEYTRGTETLTLPAVIADVVIEAADEEGFITRHEATDFLVPSDRLVFGGELADPAAGDRIRARRGARLVTYEARSFGTTSHFEPADPEHVMWRIHTKQVLVE